MRGLDASANLARCQSRFDGISDFHLTRVGDYMARRVGQDGITSLQGGERAHGIQSTGGEFHVGLQRMKSSMQCRVQRVRSCRKTSSCSCKLQRWRCMAQMRPMLRDAAALTRNLLSHVPCHALFEFGQPLLALS